MINRLIDEPITKESLEKAAVEQAGLLGKHTKEEYNRLMKYQSCTWSFKYSPLKTEEGVGLVKMIPRSKRSLSLLDKGRAKVLCKRHKWLSEPKAIGFIKICKRHSRGMHPRVQDFLIAHWSCDELIALIKEHKSFIQKVKDLSSVDFNDGQLDAIYKLIIDVRKAMIKAKSKKLNYEESGS